ncbi:MAG: hypothetical protein LBC94_05840 [Desulfovibrio sp.]|jgi:Meckel syndrome type 1 protein|nr:hypothetical protein [Desulfovibrio sp.]
MADPQNVNEEIIDLTELIEKGDKAAAGDVTTGGKTAPKTEENPTGTALESLNEATTVSPEGDIEALLAQMDADGKDEAGAPAEPLVADDTGHVVDPHEKLDMSGMEEVDNLLSSLQIPLQPAPVEDTSQASAQDADAPGEPPTAPAADNGVFDLDALLNPVATLNEVTAPLPEAKPQSAPPAEAQAQAEEKSQSISEASEFSAELDDILAAAGEPELPEDMLQQLSPNSSHASAREPDLPEDIPQQPLPENENTLLEENPPEEEMPTSPPPEETQKQELSEPAEDLPAVPLPRVVGRLRVSPGPTERRPPAKPLGGPRFMEVPPPGPAERQLPANTTPPDNASPAEKTLDLPGPALSANLASATGLTVMPDTDFPLAERLQKVEARLVALENNLAETGGAEALQTLERRLTALEAAIPAASPIKEENSALAGESAQAMHAYMELAARLDEMEARLKAVTEHFETRVEKAAATAAAKLLREEIANLLVS